MKPEELTTLLRARVKTDLTRRVVFALNSSDDDKTTSLADLLLAFNITTPENAQTLAKVVRVLVKDQSLEDHMSATMAGYKSQPELEAIMLRLASDPDSVSDQEADKVLSLLLNDDRLITAPIKIILENAEIRDILRIPAEFTFSRYVADMRAALRESKTYEEFRKKTAVVTEGLLFSALTAVAVVTLVTVAAVVHTVVVAVNYVGAFAVALKAAVFTVAGQTVSSVPNGVVPPQIGPLESACTNQSGTLVWVLVDDHGRYRRVPLIPGRDTRELGLCSIAGILVGGPGNPVVELRRNGLPVRDGMYGLRCDTYAPGIIIIKNSGEYLIVDTNEAQAEAEHLGTAGENRTATTADGRAFSMDTVAAAVPAGFDYAATMRATVIAQRFYRTLRFVDALQQVRIAR